MFSIADHQNQLESWQNPFCQCHSAKGRKLSVISDVKCAPPLPNHLTPNTTSVATTEIWKMDAIILSRRWNNGLPSNGIMMG